MLSHYLTFGLMTAVLLFGVYFAIRLGIVLEEISNGLKSDNERVRCLFFVGAAVVFLVLVFALTVFR